MAILSLAFSILEAAFYIIVIAWILKNWNRN